MKDIYNTDFNIKYEWSLPHNILNPSKHEKINTTNYPHILNECINTHRYK